MKDDYREGTLVKWRQGTEPTIYGIVHSLIEDRCSIFWSDFHHWNNITSGVLFDDIKVGRIIVIRK